MTHSLSPIVLLLAAPFVGSFLGVVVTRLPRGEGFVWGRSRCDHCHKALGLPEILPLAGWLVTRGRCRSCGGAVSLLYPALESASIIVVIWSALVVPPWLLWVSCALGWTLLALGTIDFREMLLPNLLTLPLIVAGLAVSWWIDETRLPAHVLGALAGGGFVAVLAIMYRRLRGREGIGWGDAKLLAGAGAWLSWESLPSVVLIASATCLVWVMLSGRLKSEDDLSRPVPFGTFLSAAIWIIWLHGPLDLLVFR